MKVFLYKIILFIILFVGIVLVGAKVLSARIEKKNFLNHETESDLLVYRANSHYDLAFTGISHARNISSYGNHPKVEEILNKKILNLGLSHGTCGAKDQFMFLEFMYKENVAIDTVIHIISPPYLYADYLNKEASTLMVEPFRFDFLLHYLTSYSENKIEKLFYYVRSKYQKSWIEYEPSSLEKKLDSLKMVDFHAIEKGMKVAFKNKKEETVFDDNISFLRRSLELVEKNNGKSIMLITPTLFGDWPNSERMFTECKKLEQEFGVVTFNLSSVMNDPNLFFDHHHLNSDGVFYFIENHLKPIFK